MLHPRPLDQVDLLILQVYSNRSRDGKSMPSIPELVQDVPGINSVGAIHKRLQNLVAQGLINQPPRRNMPRSYTISDTGKRILRQELNPTTGGYGKWPPT